MISSLYNNTFELLPTWSKAIVIHKIPYLFKLNYMLFFFSIYTDICEYSPFFACRTCLEFSNLEPFLFASLSKLLEYRPSRCTLSTTLRQGIFGDRSAISNVLSVLSESSCDALDLLLDPSSDAVSNNSSSSSSSYTALCRCRVRRRSSGALVAFSLGSTDSAISYVRRPFDVC